MTSSLEGEGGGLPKDDQWWHDDRGGGSKAVQKFSGNSSISETTGFPNVEMMKWQIESESSHECETPESQAWYCIKKDYVCLSEDELELEH